MAALDAITDGNQCADGVTSNLKSQQDLGLSRSISKKMEEPDRYFFRFRPRSWKLSGDRHDHDCQENFIHLTFAEVGCLAVRFDFVLDTGNFGDRI